jgi:hypothetical protein
VAVTSATGNDLLAAGAAILAVGATMVAGRLGIGSNSAACALTIDQSSEAGQGGVMTPGDP